MTKRRLYKMTPLQRDILAKVLVETQKEFPPEQAEKMQVLRERTRQAHKCRLYLDDEELGAGGEFRTQRFPGGGQGHRRIRPCPLRAAQQQVQAGACAISLAVIPFPPDPVGVFFHGIRGIFCFYERKDLF